MISSDETETLSVEHVQYQSSGDIWQILTTRDLTQFDLAILDQCAAEHCDDKPETWEQFKKAKLPPVLLSRNQSKSLNEIRLRAAFASILPESPDFDAVRSAVQIGCSFNHGDSQDDPADDKPAREIISRNILVADDNRTNLMVLETILTNAGHEVTAVLDGEKALQELENGDFDLVFLDVNMPTMGGIECCKLWRQIEGSRSHIPVIGLTADSTKETEKKCLDAGMDLRLTKPIETKELLDTIAEHTQRSECIADAIAESDDPFGVVQHIDQDGDKAAACPIDAAQMDYLLSIGDEAFVQSIVDAYLEDATEIMAAFSQSVEAGNIENFRFQAHAFKSGAANIGAIGLSEICAKLESISQPEFEVRRDEYLARVKTEVTRITDYLQNQKSKNQIL